MATILADPAGTSVQALVNNATSGDTISCGPGVYHQAVLINRNIDLTITSADPANKAIFDGQRLLANGINYQGNKRFDCTDLEVRYFTAYGIKTDNPNTTGSGAKYQPTLVMNPASTYRILRNHVHHIGQGTLVSGGNATNWGIWINAGYKPQVKNNLVHHCGDANEAIGIVSYYGYQPEVTDNEIYDCRKEGIRYGYGVGATVERNRIYGCWVGITHEFAIGSRASNNLIYDCDFGTYIKQSNSTQVIGTGTTINQFWGDAAGLGGAPLPPQKVSFAHNTVGACRWAHVGINTQYFQDYVDVRNNLFVGATHTNAGGTVIPMGDTFISDAGAGVSGDNITIDYNAYVTAFGAPASWITKGLGAIGSPQSAFSLAGLQAWVSAGYTTPRGWEANGQTVAPPGMTATKIGARDFSHTGNITGGYDLTSNPVNAIGSPYGTQVGADVSTITSPAASVTYIGGPPVVDSASPGGNGHPERTVDLRFYDYWQTAAGASNIGLNKFVILDLGSVKAVNGFFIGYSQTNGAQAKKIRLEYSNDKVTWTNVNATPGLDMWPNASDPSGDTITHADNQVTTHVIEFLSAVNARYWRYTVVDVWTLSYCIVSAILPIFTTPNVATAIPPSVTAVTPGRRLHGLGSGAR